MWRVFIAVVFVVIWAVLHHLRESQRSIPPSIPWAGTRRVTTFSKARLYIRSIFDSHGMLQEGYNEYSRRGIPCVFANLFTGAEILLPVKYMDWIHDQPEQILSSFEAHRQFMRADWTFLHPIIFHEHVFEQVIKRQLTRQLDRLTPALAEEALVAINDAAVTMSDGWFELNDHASWKRVVLQTVSRIYVGLPLCRDASYLSHAATFNDLSMLIAALVGMVPSYLRPVLAPLITLRDRWHHSRCAARTKPIIAKRIEDIVNSPDGDGPDDLVTWAVKDALYDSETGHVKRSLDFLAARISMMNFVSIDSTSITIENVLYDILANPDDRVPGHHRDSTPGSSLLDDLIAEARAAYETHCKQEPDWKHAIGKLPLLDACLKESFRLNNFISRTNVRTVMRDEGLIVPEVGTVKKGVNVAVSLWGVHHDEDFYPEPARWRMSRWVEESSKKKVPVFGDGGIAVDGHYLPFGYRRHACPGRFFALRVVKLILMHLILFFDISMPDGKRPGNPWLGVSRGPPMGGRLRFRPSSTYKPIHV